MWELYNVSHDEGVHVAPGAWEGGVVVFAALFL